MLIDLHMHESTCSQDSILHLEDMVRIAQKLGLEGICITDHDSMGLRKTAEAYAAKVGFPIFVGVEYYSLQGDIVAFGLDTLPQKRLSAQDFIDYVKSRGGVCFSAHPYRSNNRGLGDHLFTVNGLCGIEAFNGSTGFEANRKALARCRELGIQPLGVSDCHVPQKVGVYATDVPGHFHTLPALVQALKKGGCTPVVSHRGRYVNLLSLTDMLEPESCLLPANEDLVAMHPGEIAV